MTKYKAKLFLYQFHDNKHMTNPNYITIRMDVYSMEGLSKYQNIKLSYNIGIKNPNTWYFFQYHGK